MLDVDLKLINNYFYKETIIFASIDVQISDLGMHTYTTVSNWVVYNYVYMCMCVYVCISVCMSMHICMLVHEHAHMYVGACMCVLVSE